MTIIARLPAHERLVKDLCAFLKRSLGSGGTHYIKSGEGFIEIQGERVEELRRLVEEYRRPKVGSN